jgi:hypothetical protein
MRYFIAPYRGSFILVFGTTEYAYPCYPAGKDPANSTLLTYPTIERASEYCRRTYKQEPVVGENITIDPQFDAGGGK